MTEAELSGLALVAELAVGLAGFSGVMIVLIKPSGGFSKPERVRLINLIYFSFGAMFLAIVPFAFAADSAVSWRLTGALASVYLLGGLLYIPRSVLLLRREFTDLFPLNLWLVQSGLHGIALALGLAVAFGVSAYPSRLYFCALVFLLIQSSIVYVRVLFYRRN